MRPLKEKISITIDSDILEIIREEAIGRMTARYRSISTLF